MFLLTLHGRAEVIDYIYQSGPNVMSSYSGTLDITDLTRIGGSGPGSYIQPIDAFQIFASSSISVYQAISGPTTWGSGAYLNASSSTGAFGLDAGDTDLVVPGDYVSGSMISGSEEFDSQTLASIGLVAGVYTYTWGTGPDADSLVVEIGTAPPVGSAVPEPAPISLVLLAVAALSYPVFLRRRAVAL